MKPLISTTLFVLVILLLFLKLSIGNRVLLFLGKLSMETYISQGLFIYAFRSKCVYIENEVLFCISVIVCTITFLLLFHKFINLILNVLYSFELRIKELQNIKLYNFMLRERAFAYGRMLTIEYFKMLFTIYIICTSRRKKAIIVL